MKRFYNTLFMEDLKRNTATDVDKEIVFSKAIKAGKRIYYLDVKKNRKGEMFLAITESKKVVSGEGNAPQVSFEKHKIFLYKEDFTPECTVQKLYQNRAYQRMQTLF